MTSLPSAPRARYAVAAAQARRPSMPLNPTMTSRQRYRSAAAQARRMLHARGSAARLPFGDWARGHLLERGFSPREADAAIRAAFAAATDRLRADPALGGAFAGTPAGARGQRPFLANCVRYIRGVRLPAPVEASVGDHLMAHPELVWRLAALGHRSDAR